MAESNRCCDDDGGSLSRRVDQWQQSLGSIAQQDMKLLTLQGVALREEARRSRGNAVQLLPRIEQLLHEPDASEVMRFMDQAIARINAAVVGHRGRDREQSFSAVDLFYTVLDGLIVAEQLGGDELAKSAAVLFNKAVAQIDQFEPAAGVAEQMIDRSIAVSALSHLFCATVQRLGEPDALLDLEEPDLVEEGARYLTLSELLAQTKPNQAIYAGELAKAISPNTWWYVKWAAQRLRVAVETRPASILRVDVFEGAAEKSSKGMDGWEIQFAIGNSPIASGKISGGVARLNLPARQDLRAATLKVRAPQGVDWSELHAGIEASSEA
jgi:hypothetical protein